MRRKIGDAFLEDEVKVTKEYIRVLTIGKSMAWPLSIYKKIAGPFPTPSTNIGLIDPKCLQRLSKLRFE